MEPDDRFQSLLEDSLRAHALIFETPLAPSYGNAAGIRMLVAFLVVAVGMFFALRFVAGAAGLRGLPAANLGFVVALLAAFVVAQRAFVRMPMAAVGLRRFADWKRRERLIYFEVVPLATVVFAIVFHAHLLRLLELSTVCRVPAVLCPHRSSLGNGAGVPLPWLVADRAHPPLRGPNRPARCKRSVHFRAAAPPAISLSRAACAGLFAAVFGIGLFFGIVYYRSGNLWIPAVLHGLWPPNMS